MNEEIKGEMPQARPDERERLRERAEALWIAASRAVRKPSVGAGVAGATVLAAGAIWGVTEAALAVVAVWAVFRTLKKRERSEHGGNDAEEKPTPARSRAPTERTA